MKLTRKLIVAIGLGIFIVLALNTLLRVQRDRHRYEEDIVRDHQLLSNALTIGVELLAKSEDARALEVVEAVNREQSHVTVRWVRDLNAREPEGPTFGPLRRPLSTDPESEVVVHNGERFMVTRDPVHVSGKPLSMIEIVESLAQEQSFSRYTWVRATVVFFAIFGFCLVFLVFFGTTFVGRPLRELAEQARRISAGDLSKRLHFTQNDEIRELAEEMNAMSDRLARANDEIQSQTQARLDALEQLRHADRLRTIGELASGIAHELGTPLNVIRARGMMVASGEVNSDRSRELGGIIVEQADRMTATIREVLAFARRSPATKKALDLVAWLPTIETFIAPLAARAGVSIRRSIAADTAIVLADPNLLSQAVTNLVVNALHATASGGSVTLTLHREVKTPPADHGGAEAAFIALGVTDTGRGIEQEHISRVFEPFYTTKPPGEGTGLGLPIARDIVREHGGFIELTSSIGAGTTFIIYLPETSVERDS